MNRPIFECVPNFSEGRNPQVIQAIADAIKRVDGVRLLNVDPGASTNRTVYTFAGEAEPVKEAAFQAAKVALELIDMAHHTGEHPRFGALDVCPIVPIANCTMEDAIEHARDLARRLGEELGMTIYCYGKAALKPDRADLSHVRSGEYEGLAAKLADPAWKPDFGPSTFQAKSGASAVGARDILIAYNVNLNTTSLRRANAIAFDVRERGRVRRSGDPLTGEIIRDAEGNPEYEPGMLKSVKAIGWYLDEYGICQVSMNLTDMRETPLHVAFDACAARAEERGLRATGSELIGLVPLSAMLDAGRYFLRKQQRSVGVSDAELIKIAIRSMGLDELAPFNPQERIIEYALRDPSQKLLVDYTVRGFVEETASESPAPGGGSIAATMGAMGAALATMVANLSSHKRGWDERWEEFSNWAERGKAIHDELLFLIDEDTRAFNTLMAAFGLPKSTDAEKTARSAAIQSATRYATEIPLRVMETSCSAFDVIEAMARDGNQNSISDAGVGALAVRSAVLGAQLNVLINAGSLKDKEFVASVTSKAQELADKAVRREQEVLAIVRAAMSKG